MNAIEYKMEDFTFEENNISETVFNSAIIIIIYLLLFNCSIAIIFLTLLTKI